MAAVSLPKFSGSEEDVIPFLKGLLSDLEDQLQSLSAVVINSDPAKPRKGVGRKDLSIDFNSDGSISLRIQKPDKSFFTISLNTDLNRFKNLQSAAGAPSTVHFPVDGDWGYYIDTGGPTYYIARNFQGTIKKTTLT